MPQTLYTGPIIDSHLHLFDPRRPQGIPWPEPGNRLYAAHLPRDYWTVASSHNVVGAIAVEASPWRDDNRWILETLRSDPRMLGFVGNLDPLHADFAADLAALVQEPLFLGLRYGNLWDRDLLLDQTRPGFINGLRQLAASGRSLDSANPNPRLIKGLLKLSDALPELRIIVDHLPNAQVPAGEEAAYHADLLRLAERPNVFAKLAEIPQVGPHGLIVDTAFYNDRLAVLWEAFGDERCFFGSDWPNSDHLADFATTLGLVKSCLAHKPEAVQAQFFLHNAVRIYTPTHGAQ
ncbi:amidohydrolase [Pseudomonas sp. PB105]|uniref:amidohydrolase family protein n=1 Tax=unclassified Pseudomonas TaxID=196821 RepID=UPI00131E0C9D|nr:MULTISPECIES: amidohydrolase family protein [unclassified Pseudomonas]KAE9653550.1 amidohydrolase [Pseudomonas sp. PB105]MCM2361468.1 amidohydrolase family protein [Pseudomonas sp. SR18]MVW95940.1 amidohydrolase [Pseudomonas sp. PB100]